MKLERIVCCVNIVGCEFGSTDVLKADGSKVSCDVALEEGVCVRNMVVDSVGKNDCTMGDAVGKELGISLEGKMVELSDGIKDAN
jgi:hypothetical protein